MKTAAELAEKLFHDPSATVVIEQMQLEAYRAGESSMRERAAKAAGIKAHAINCDHISCNAHKDDAASIRALPLSDEVPR